MDQPKETYIKNNSRRVLVLDATMWPIGTVGWQKAICLSYTGKVHTLVEYDYVIRSPSIELKAPAVIEMYSYVHKQRTRRIKFSRHNVFIRDKGKCQYCQRPISYDLATLDHVIPKAQDGLTSWENIVIACPMCNRSKADRTPKQACMKLITVPKKPSFETILKITLGNFTQNLPEEWKTYLPFHW